MKFVSLEQVIYLHEQIVQETGGTQGVRDFGLLHSALERPKVSFGNQDLYPDIFFKAAALFHSLILNHPFVDGNKRTALAALTLFLEKNGYVLKAEQSELIFLCLDMEGKKTSIKKLALWIKDKVKK